MKITAIHQQVKQKDRYSVYVEGKYAFSLSEQALLDAKIFSGQELDAAQLAAFKQLSADDKAFGQALRYALMRPRSIGEMQDYFRRKQFAEPICQKILNKLTDYGLLDDLAFARIWVENRRLLKSVSRRKLAMELKQKHVPAEIIDAVLAEDKEATDEVAVLRQLIARKRQRYPDPQKLIAFLARQGYRYDDIQRALRDDD